MERCLELGGKGIGSAAPNPSVGCVIVENGEIIGEGFTSPYGGPHAEVNAILSVQDRSRLESATLYVSLEPCSHFGKTPPCTDLIIKNRIARVVIGLKDPHHLVNGSGIDRLMAAGCEVITGVLEDQCSYHHRRFLTYHIKKRPYIILKWAESTDGFLAPLRNKREKNPTPYWITGKPSRQLVHKWRSMEQGILIGSNTAIEDNPSLTTRLWKGRSPVRIILDKNAVIDPNNRVFNSDAKTIVFTDRDSSFKPVSGIEYIQVSFEKDLASQVCSELYERHFLSILVEGGNQTLTTFIKSEIWDEAHIFKGPTSFDEGLPAPELNGNLIDIRQIGKDELRTIAHV